VMGKKKSHATRGETGPDVHSLASRLGTHFTITAAVIVTDVGVGLMFNSGAETTWPDVAWMVVHALAIGAVVFLWLPVSVWLAGQVHVPEVAAEGLTLLGLGLLVAGAELGLLRGPDRVAQTVVAVAGMLAGWAMRIEPPEPKKPPRKR
jgi:low temperature requirement protein LtrA